MDLWDVLYQTLDFDGSEDRDKYEDAVQKLYSWLLEHGPSSTRLSNWFIQVVGDPQISSQPDLLFKMLLMFKKILRLSLAILNKQ